MKTLEGTGIRVQQDITKLTLAVLKATWKFDEVEKLWTPNILKMERNWLF